MPFCVQKFDSNGNMQARTCSEKETNPYGQAGAVIEVKDCKDCPPFPAPPDTDLHKDIQTLIGLITKLIEKLK